MNHSNNSIWIFAAEYGECGERYPYFFLLVFRSVDKKILSKFTKEWFTYMWSEFINFWYVFLSRFIWRKTTWRKSYIFFFFCNETVPQFFSVSVLLDEQMALTCLGSVRSVFLPIYPHLAQVNAPRKRSLKFHHWQTSHNAVVCQ